MKTQTINLSTLFLVVIPFSLMSFTSPKEETSKNETVLISKNLSELKLESTTEKEALKVEEWMLDDNYWKISKTDKKAVFTNEVIEEELKIEAWMSDDSLWASK